MWTPTKFLENNLNRTSLGTCRSPTGHLRFHRYPLVAPARVTRKVYSRKGLVSLVIGRSGLFSEGVWQSQESPEVFSGLPIVRGNRRVKRRRKMFLFYLQCPLIGKSAILQLKCFGHLGRVTSVEEASIKLFLSARWWPHTESPGHRMEAIGVLRG
jgi:hypothetical protein